MFTTAEHREDKGTCAFHKGLFEHTTFTCQRSTALPGGISQNTCPSQTNNTAGISFIQGPYGVGEVQLSSPRKCPPLIKSKIISQLPVMISLLLLYKCAAFLIQRRASKMQPMPSWFLPQQQQSCTWKQPPKSLQQLQGRSDAPA